MHRCRIHPESWNARPMMPADGEADRLRRVLRLKDGDTVVAFDGCGHSAHARLRMDAADGTIGLFPVAAAQGAVAEAAPLLPLLLFQAIPKAARMDWLVEKVTELGVSAVIPLVTERGVVRPDAQRDSSRRQRWRRIAQEAARQCGLAIVPEIEPPQTFAAALERVMAESLSGVYGSLESDAMPLRQALAGPEIDVTRPLALFIGPEGDFSPSETARLRAAGMQPVTLGPRVLRVETAALSAVCLLGYEWRREAATPHSG